MHFYAARPEIKANEFAEITQNNGHYTPFKVTQGHRSWYQSKAHMRLPISELPPTLHCFRDIAFDMFKIAIFGYPETISVKFSVDVNGWPTYHNGLETLPKFQPAE